VDLRRAWHGTSGARRLILLVWLVVGLSPMWLGPLLTPLRVAVAEGHHVCACGMTPGTCGCPECERTERERLSPGAAEPAPVLKGECDDRQVPLGGGHVPAAIPPAPIALAAPSSVAAASPLGAPATHARGPTAPPTRPPRPGTPG